MVSKARRIYTTLDGRQTVTLAKAQQMAIDRALRADRASPQAGRPWSEVKAELEAQRCKDAAQPIVSTPVEVRI